MRKFLMLLTLFIASIGYGQVDVTLTVSQLPEFGFDISSQDTTIASGDSVTLGGDLVIFGGAGNYLYYWSPGEYLNDSTILNPIAKPTETTTFYLTVEDAYGCTFSLDYTVYVLDADSSTGTNSIAINNLEFDAKLYPNPNSGQFKIELTGTPCDIIHLYIMDTTGKIHQALTVNDFSGVQTEEFEVVLEKGIYVLIVESEDQKAQRRFIIK